MTTIRILVGTRKGAFILSSDARRKKWSVDGPHFAGWEIYHLKGSSVDANRIYASQTSSWFGQIIQRSDDGGKSWSQPGSDGTAEKAAAEGTPQGESNMFVYDTSEETGKPLTTHQWYDGTQHPWEFARVWHLEPSLDDPDTCYAGAGGMCLHTIVLDPKNKGRIFCAISAAGTFRSDDSGETCKPINQGLHSEYIPNPTAESQVLRQRRRCDARITGCGASRIDRFRRQTVHDRRRNRRGINSSYSLQLLKAHRACLFPLRPTACSA